MIDYLSADILALIVLALVASLVNGMVGYGFSSIVTPIALLWMTSKTLNPALILVELGVNLALLFRERRFISATFPRASPVMVGLLPGVVVGTLALSYISPNDVKIFVYVMLLPLILLQLIGLRRTIQNERGVGVPLGTGIGFLYSLTTISGPPLALFWRNQGTSKGEFRCAMAQVRVAEASFTAITYYLFHLYTATSVAYVPPMVLPVLIGVPVGTLVLAKFSRDSFSRIVMAADGIFVSFGLVSVLGKIKVLPMDDGLLIFVVATAILVAMAARAISRLPSIHVETDEPDRTFGRDPAVPGGPS